MGTATTISVRKYLSTSYSPDCEYVDGEVLERNLGEFEHARLQALLTIHFGNREDEWGILVVPEQRVQVAATRFRVPDVCVLRSDQPTEPIFKTPPLICIEILSPEDTLRRVQDKVQDYLRFGVANIWILDPAMKIAYICTASGLHKVENGELAVANTPIRLDLPTLFSRL